MSTALRSHVSHTTASRGNRIDGIGIPADGITTTQDVFADLVTVAVAEAAGALRGEDIAVLDIEVGDVLVSALRISVTGGTITVDNIAADATVAAGTVTFASEDFGADDTLVLTYINVA